MLEELIEYDITKDDFEDDWAIIRAVWLKNVPIDTQVYVVNQYMDRINKFDDMLTTHFFTSLSIELCEKCSDFIKTRIQLLDKEILAKVFYICSSYNNLTGIANYLVNQDWFKNDEKYKDYIICYNLIKKNNYEDIEKLNEDEMLDYGSFILNMLSKVECNVNLTNMIIKNYIELVKKYDLELYNCFIEQGYKVIDEFIENEVMLNRNMIIFDCHVTSSLYDIKSLNYVEFTEEENYKIYGSFKRFINNGISININSIYRTYDVFSYKTASLYLLHVLSHELVHADQHDYIENLKPVRDDLTKLRIYNCLISCSLMDNFVELYNEEHDCFYHEFDADIKGLEILYQKCKFLPNITRKDIEIFNKEMAAIILDSYYDCINLDDNSLKTKLSPVQFSKSNLIMIKDKLSVNDKEKLTFTPELGKIESNLTDYEKFILGYDNPYLEILDVVANENSNFSFGNLIEGLSKFYDEYNMFFDKKYEFLKEDVGKTKVL